MAVFSALKNKAKKKNAKKKPVPTKKSALKKPAVKKAVVKKAVALKKPAKIELKVVLSAKDVQAIVDAKQAVSRNN